MFSLTGSFLIGVAQHLAKMAPLPHHLAMSIDTPIAHSSPRTSGRPQRIEEPLNKLLIHKISIALLPRVIATGIHPNWLSLMGLGFGLLGAYFYYHWTDPRMAFAGLGAMLLWHIFDGLDGQVARATGRTSAFGRVLDGICDHGCYIAVYLSLVYATGATALSWALAVSAGIAHAIQAAWYEGERLVYQQRIAGKPRRCAPIASTAGAVEKLYNKLQFNLSGQQRPIDAWLEHHPQDREAYASAAEPVLRAMTMFGPSTRTLLIFCACIASQPQAFWLLEIIFFSVGAIICALWLRSAEKLVVQPR